MILGEMVGTTAESPGSNAAGKGVTYALENCHLMLGVALVVPGSLA
jgi:hypothetical protein